jgi:hypothetical protein
VAADHGHRVEDLRLVFLDAAHQQLGGPLVVVWHNLNTHVSAAMAQLIAARDWLTLCQLPPYAHELSPVEPVWSRLKRSLANLAKHSISQLTALVKTRLKRMQYQPGLLAGTGLDLTPFCNPASKDLLGVGGFGVGAGGDGVQPGLHVPFPVVPDTRGGLSGRSVS